MYVNSRAPTTAAPLDAVTSSASARRTDPTPAPSGVEATSTRVSGPAQLMSKLSQLRDSDPDRFSQVASGMAADLRNAASKDSGMGSKMLTALASRLDDIASGGSIGQLEPSASPPGGGGAARSAAVQAYRANAAQEPTGTQGTRAAIAQVLDDLDAALKSSASPER
ncbi:MAG TPA: hypothetical protein VMG12_28295 [Polyangiaceae bacterium]|nr:hypothetical protein [Polyangiaceae bacterium]